MCFIHNNQKTEDNLHGHQEWEVSTDILMVYTTDDMSHTWVNLAVFILSEKKEKAEKNIPWFQCLKNMVIDVRKIVTHWKDGGKLTTDWDDAYRKFLGVLLNFDLGGCTHSGIQWYM